MTDFLSNWYPWIKALHVMSIITWMAGLFYLPRLYVYHVEGLKKQGVVHGSDMDKLFQHQER
ncbi:MAG: CopD family protein, partial [Rhodobacteraceae bacterium]|nr:CopD family protein [Paracoccaceae bacterium]